MQQEAAPSLLIAGERRPCRLHRRPHVRAEGALQRRRQVRADQRGARREAGRSARIAARRSVRVSATRSPASRWRCRSGPQRTTPGRSSRACRPAVVVGPAGEEIFTDKYGRVKVQFHWDREGKNDLNSSCWMRVGTSWAGKQWGAIHIPRIGPGSDRRFPWRAIRTSRSSSAASTTPR